LPRIMEFPRLLSRIRRTRPIQCPACVRYVHSKNKRKQYERRQTDIPREKPFDRRPFVNRRPVEEFRAKYEPARQVDTQSPSTKPRFVNQNQEEVDRPPPYKGAKSPAAMERARRKADAMVRLWENGPPPPPSVERKIPKDVYVPVIVEEKEIVCINKPPNLLSQPGLPGEGTILDLLRFQRRDLQPLQTVNRYIPLVKYN
jgi:23S rRNA-/tRNA-specific pseudouridylate synthase